MSTPRKPTEESVPIFSVASDSATWLEGTASETPVANRVTLRDMFVSLTDKSPVETHYRIMGGFPAQTIIAIVEQSDLFKQKDNINKAFGLSIRTLQRLKSGPGENLTPDTSARVWKFANILKKAANIFGSYTAAESWMTEPALGLQYAKPIDLLETSVGADAVETLLDQIETGVYV